MTRRGWGGMTLIVIAAIAVSYMWIDRPVALWCRASVTGAADAVFQVITAFGVSTWYLVASALGYGLFRYVRPDAVRAVRSLFLFAAVAVSGLAADVVKGIAGRFRPAMLFEHDLYGFDFFHWKHAMTSFPSGHTATAFSLAAAVALMWPRWRIPAFGFALLVALSRIAITAHYVSDTLGGALIGVATVAILHARYFKSKLC